MASGVVRSRFQVALPISSLASTPLPPTAATPPVVVKMYERELKAMNPHVQHITYDIQHLLKYVDELQDVSALV